MEDAINRLNIETNDISTDDIDTNLTHRREATSTIHNCVYKREVIN
jgi:hypothetical protein